jgi:redox-sensitive bicupin YhaK (pirin superfamily)
MTGELMAVVQLIDSRKRDLGGFVVRRVLPAATRQMVGPFIFFDHLGPTRFQPGEGIDVRPHPHIALATVTYLFAGSLLHRDSLGSVQEIKPGDVNWMSAGEGIVHSERTPSESRPQGPHVHGIQSWVALPDGREEGEPSFTHTAAAALPHLKLGEVTLSVIAGQAFGARSPVQVLWPTLYVDAQLPAGATLEVPAEYAERAVYVAEGRLSIGETQLNEGQLAVLETGATIPVRAVSASRMLLLGGEPFATPRFIEWNFVASSRERIERAKQRWRAQEFSAVPGETEFIPLP